MVLELAGNEDRREITALDKHVPLVRLDECIAAGRVFVLRENSVKDTGSDRVIGVLRYSLFWQMIPFVDLLYIEEKYRGMGLGTFMMLTWEEAMAREGYRNVMTSTQSDEDAFRFYEKIGYRKAGGFFPPDQDAEEWIYIKELEMTK